MLGTSEGMPLLKVCRVQNSGLILMQTPFLVLVACSMQKLQVIKTWRWEGLGKRPDLCFFLLLTEAISDPKQEVRNGNRTF